MTTPACPVPRLNATTCLQQPRMLAGEIVNSPEAASEFLATDQEAAEPEKSDAKPIEAEQ